MTPICNYDKYNKLFFGDKYLTPPPPPNDLKRSKNFKSCLNNLKRRLLTRKILVHAPLCVESHVFFSKLGWYLYMVLIMV